METEELVSCPICENNSFKFYLTARDFTATAEEFQLKTCTRCNFLVTSPRPTEAGIARYYTSDKYISHSGKANSVFDSIYLAARQLTMRWKFNLIKNLTQQPATLLDYGCGTGDFLHYMNSKGYEVLGVEPNQAAREKANHKLKGKVSENLNSINGQSINIISLWHVLEHVHKLNETLERLKHILKPDGFIIIAVPNPCSHDCKKYHKYWAAYDVPRHLWHFTQESIQHLMKRNGLQVIDTKPMKLDSYYVSLLSESYKHPKRLKLITSLLAFIEGLYSNFLSRKSGEYSSLIYIVQRR